MDWQDMARLRSPGFTIGRRGYDQREVDKFLEQLVDWLETDAAQDIGQVAVTRKLELVGKSTAHILLTTEQEAQELKRQTAEDCAELRAHADAEARKVREAADTYAQEVRARAEGDARRTREDATSRPPRPSTRACAGAARSTIRSTSSRPIAPPCSTSSPACATSSAPRSTRPGPQRRRTASPSAKARDAEPAQQS